MYTCTKCGVEKELTEFIKSKRKLGHTSACRLCEKARVKKWNEENVEKKRELSAKASKKYRETLKTLTKEEKEEKFKNRLIPEQRVCFTCKQEKSIIEFYKNKNIASGHEYECRTCKNNYRKEWNKNNPEKLKQYDKTRYENNKENNIERAKKWYQENKERVLANKKIQYKENPNSYEEDRKKGLKRKYNITPEFVEELRIKQENRCAICANEFTGTPYIDHCHKTEIVRGLLCHSCNVSIGLLKENSETLSNAIKYLAQQ